MKTRSELAGIRLDAVRVGGGGLESTSAGEVASDIGMEHEGLPSSERVCWDAHVTDERGGGVPHVGREARVVSGKVAIRGPQMLKQLLEKNDAGDSWRGKGASYSHPTQSPPSTGVMCLQCKLSTFVPFVIPPKFHMCVTLHLCTGEQ